jgi:hypothetical protein
MVTPPSSACVGQHDNSVLDTAIDLEINTTHIGAGK